MCTSFGKGASQLRRDKSSGRISRALCLFAWLVLNMQTFAKQNWVQVSFLRLVNAARTCLWQSESPRIVPSDFWGRPACPSVFIENFHFVLISGDSLSEPAFVPFQLRAGF